MLGLKDLRVAVQKANLADKAIVAKALKAAGDVEGFWDVLENTCLANLMKDWVHFRSFIKDVIQDEVFPLRLILDIAVDTDKGFLAALMLERYNNLLRYYPCWKCGGQKKPSYAAMKTEPFSHASCASSKLINDEQLGDYLSRSLYTPAVFSTSSNLHLLNT
ncbi:hypothetical protein TWF970_004368 [Orbilia oligospora]|uniref:Uncharacterized protein n=1 Tax=Orbilia oligospora TaxID=2813651 RepID=A0A7C8VEZ8_ORBOL|nr:hypothetical protein TWF970_004368 [Orbilia oligospora]